jgi:hypothetical protein
MISKHLMAKLLLKLAVPTGQGAFHFHDGVEIVFILYHNKHTAH